MQDPNPEPQDRSERSQPPAPGKGTWLVEGRPELARREGLRVAVERAQAGQDYKSNLEDLLKSLLPDDAEEHLMIRQETRGAFALLLEESGGRVLFLGDALSGTTSALLGLGFRLTIADHDPDRLAFAKVRDDALFPGCVEHVQLDPSQPLPFSGVPFEIVVAELGRHGEEPVWGPSIDPVLALASQTLVWIADNALAYKRALGRRGRFEYVKPWSWVARALRPEPSEGTRRQYRIALEARFPRFEALALYPHRLECSHVIRLDAPGPQLTVGPKERRNKVKVWAQKMGALPWLAPSFAWVATHKKKSEDHRLQRVLDELSERFDAPRHRAQHLISTRGNVGVVQTQSTGKTGGEGPTENDWTLHIPLCAQKRRLLSRHADCLQDLPKAHPGVSIPKLYFAGRSKAYG